MLWLRIEAVHGFSSSPSASLDSQGSGLGVETLVRAYGVEGLGKRVSGITLIGLGS